MQGSSEGVCVESVRSGGLKKEAGSTARDAEHGSRITWILWNGSLIKCDDQLINGIKLHRPGKDTRISSCAVRYCLQNPRAQCLLIIWRAGI